MVMAALSFYFPDSYSHQPQPPPQFSADMPADFFCLPQSPELLHDPSFPNASVHDDVVFYSDYYSTTDIYSDYYSAPSCDSFIPISDEFHYSKRQKLISADPHFFDPSFFSDGGYFPYPPEFSQVPWDNTAPFVMGAGSGSCSKKPSAGNLSAQTIAARERRRKITAKTQELAELIPGGNKMNTAEMFHSAFKYVKFLQAQVGILQLMEEGVGEMEELQILDSPVIQEKLCSEETCLVPKEFVQNLANSPEIQSQPSIFNGINQMLQISSTKLKD